MAAISDKTIIARIKAIIEATSSLFDNTAPLDDTKIHKVFKETPATGARTGRAYVNYAEILPPADTIEILDDEGSPSQMGDAETTNRSFPIIFYFKQIRAENNDRIYDAVKNFRDAIKADRTLGMSGVIDASLTWAYEINVENQSVIDDATMLLTVTVSEVF